MEKGCFDDALGDPTLSQILILRSIPSPSILPEFSFGQVVFPFFLSGRHVISGAAPVSNSLFLEYDIKYCTYTSEQDMNVRETVAAAYVLDSSIWLCPEIAQIAKTSCNVPQIEGAAAREQPRAGAAARLDPSPGWDLE